jgi:hypothetical protein
MAPSSTTASKPSAEDTTDPDGSPSWLDFMVPDTGEEIGVLVKSGSYEVDLARRQLKPCYWPSTRHRVLRGTWFAEKAPGEWVPLREFLADQLEQAYISQIWAPKKGLLTVTSALTSPEKTATAGAVHAARLDLNTIVDTGLYALFVSENEAYLVRDSSLSWLKQLPGASNATIFAPTKCRLRRGYIPPTTPLLLAKEADVATEVIDNSVGNTVPTELVLVVHGIGQTLQMANITEDALALRTGLRQLDKEYLAAAATSGGEGSSNPTSPQKKKETPVVTATIAAETTTTTASGTHLPLPVAPPKPASPSRVEVLPVQWRKTLSLEVDAASALQPPGIPGLRSVLHSTAVEVLLYLTPLHRAAVLDSLVASLNSAYSRFMLRNPEFSGKVNLVAHSLGSILCWDVLCNQPAPPGAKTTTTTTTAAAAEAHSWSAAPVEISQLAFQVDQLILAGSPLGCFLALRGVNLLKNRGLGQPNSAKLMQCHPDYDVIPDGLPDVQRFYNIYHPYDPVAYRLEPLAYSASQLAPHRGALIELYGGGGGKRLHIAAQELGDSMSSAASRLGSTLAGALSFGRGQKRPAATVGDGGKEKEKEEGAKQGDAAVAAIDAAFAGGSDAAAATSALKVDKQQQAPSLPLRPDDSINATTTEATTTPMELEFGQPEATTKLAKSSISRVAGGELPSAGGWPTAAAGRIDFALQEASLENQYVAALKAHFIYWGSMDVALFIYRAVKGCDVINGKPLVDQEKKVAAAAVAAAAVEMKNEKEVALAPPPNIVFGEADQLDPSLN